MHNALPELETTSQRSKKQVKSDGKYSTTLS
jgi:hypothetical protein